MPLNNNEPKTTAPRSGVMLTVSAVCTFFVLGWVLWSCRYGIDFADEGFYLVWISNPSKYSASITQFGFIYHPLYALLNGSITALRKVNVLITFFLAWTLSNFFLKSVLGRQTLGRAPRYIISAAFATASLVFLRLWLPTPSYNWLAFQALLISAIGLLLADKKTSTESFAGWLLLGVGGWLAFMAKPTTAAAIGLCAGLYLLASGKLNARLLATSLFTAFGLLFLSALIIDGSIINFIDRLKEGMKLAELLGAGHKVSMLFRLDSFQFDTKGKIVLTAGTVVFFFAAYFSESKIKALTYVGYILSTTFALTILAIVFGFSHKTLEAGEPFQPLLLWSIPLATILVGVSLYQLKGLCQIPRSQWALALTFLVFPHVFAFGTSNNYWLLGGLAGIFWVLAGLVFLSPIAANRNLIALLLPLGLAVQLMTVVQVLSGVEGPYYQPQPLRQNDYKIELGKQGATLLLSESFGHYIAEAIDLANRGQFEKGTPMIDLTGHSPGVLFAIGASNTGQAWIYGNFPGDSGYPGSDKVAVAVLKKVSCEEVSRAWLLAEPEGPVKISAEVLSSFGANLATDYEIAGTFRTAKLVGGFQEIKTQQFLKPVRSFDAAMSACNAAKTTK